MHPDQRRRHQHRAHRDGRQPDRPRVADRADRHREAERPGRVPGAGQPDLEPLGRVHPRPGEQRRGERARRRDQGRGDERQPEPTEVGRGRVGVAGGRAAVRLALQPAVAPLGHPLEAAPGDRERVEEREPQAAEGRVAASPGGEARRHHRRDQARAEQRLVLGDAAAEVDAAEEEQLERDPEQEASLRVAEQPAEQRRQHQWAAEHQLQRALALNGGEAGRAGAGRGERDELQRTTGRQREHGTSSTCSRTSAGSPRGLGPGAGLAPSLVRRREAAAQRRQEHRRLGGDRAHLDLGARAR